MPETSWRDISSGAAVRLCDHTRRPGRRGAAVHAHRAGSPPHPPPLFLACWEAAPLPATVHEPEPEPGEGTAPRGSRSIFPAVMGYLEGRGAPRPNLRGEGGNGRSEKKVKEHLIKRSLKYMRVKRRKHKHCHIRAPGPFPFCCWAPPRPAQGDRAEFSGT